VGDQPGGIIEKEAPVDISNVALWNAEEQRRVRVGYEVRDGRKVRVDRKTRAALD
jgi:large subunit ribosomal protein L24